MRRTDGKAIDALHEGIDVFDFEHAGLRSVFVTAHPGAAGDITSLHRRLQRILDDMQAVILEMRVFGPAALFPPCRSALIESLGPVDWPVSFVGDDSASSLSQPGIQIRAIAGARVETIHSEGRPVARLFEDDHARYCVIGDLRTPDVSSARANQVRDTIELLDDVLGRVGMDVRRIVRTWFFIDDILDWYETFNAVRDEVYSTRGIFEGYVPASTGIGGRNAHGAAVVVSAFAVEAKTGDVSVREVVSPLQGSALDYGSSFSRAAELATPDYKCLLVSGTASIDAEGRTIHANDRNAQVSRTFDVVDAILESRGMGYPDVIRANAYFRDLDDAADLAGAVARCGLPASRLVVSNNSVCRDDLLFELEVDALKTDDRSRR